MTARQPNGHKPERRYLTGWALPPFARDPRILCTPDEAERFFPDHPTVAVVEEIQAFCRPCPLRAECLAWGTEHSAGIGYYGGVSPTARRRQAARGLKAAA